MCQLIDRIERRGLPILLTAAASGKQPPRRVEALQNMMCQIASWGYRVAERARKATIPCLGKSKSSGHWGWSDERIDALQQMPACLSNPHRNLPFWHKGQTHCHSKESPDGHDGKWGFEGAYQEMGYSFAVCLTDHNRATPDPGREGIVHIDSGEDGYACRHHLCVLGINWDAVHWHHDHVDPHRDENQNGLDDRATCFCENIQPRD